MERSMLRNKKKGEEYGTKRAHREGINNLLQIVSHEQMK